jgi:hypothetical protein
MKLGTETASVVNHIMANAPLMPENGMGATVLAWTDRYAGTVTFVSPSGKRCTVREDVATHKPGSHSLTECQDYEYAPNPDGRVFEFRLTTRRGKPGWREIYGGSRGVSFGIRRAYRDPSF